MKNSVRFALRALSVLLCAGIIYLSLSAAGYINRDGADAVSSATADPASIGDMKGKWIVLINRDIHDKTGTTRDWQSFFSFDENVPLIMEDITCKVASNDFEAAETAEKYCGRLPANQMKIITEQAELLFSKAETGNFDVIILSRYEAETYGAQTICEKNNVLAVEMGENNA